MTIDIARSTIRTVASLAAVAIVAGEVPQPRFLAEAEFRAAAVEFARDAAVRGEVGGVIGVQQIKLHAAHLHLPRAQPDGVSRQADFQP